ncbi:MAG: S8 family serine peptidase [Bryobacterales bacterium]|nr:S8 family serine peptidase [Bryobacteraceae bacterium]MDW8132001.1 S8 family serine peptidase [Bryobacterales bacterium]
MPARIGCLLAIALLAAAWLTDSAAAQQPARFPVIAVFADHVRFQDYAALGAPDARAAQDPPGWSYLDRGVLGAVKFLESRAGFQAEHVFSHAIRGFAARLTARQIQELESSPLVKYVEPDGTMTVVQQTIPWGIDRIEADLSSTRAGDGWGAVTGVNVYVIDTGIDVSHPDLNVVRHVTFADKKNYDCNGHGTHVAGTIAARDNNSGVVGVIPGAPPDWGQGAGVQRHGQYLLGDQGR